MRGKDSLRPAVASTMGITPAYAGKSDLTSGTQTLLQGSPPHVRGKENGWCKAALPRRITPACAGKSYRSRTVLRPRWDHPRVCGEKALSTFSSLKNSGSPPHVRGKALCFCCLAFQIGITPACAGKRPRNRNCGFSLEDHPRMCGEKPLYLRFDNGLEGSPPHVRGKD